MALRSDWSQRTCSMARGLDILGDPWSVLVLREVFFGNGRFDAMKQRLGAADSVLTKRLAGLVAAGLLARRPYDDG
ncbi:winged helix-turn-helix transcriptional regulator, partial [Arthrobacter sp. I3]